MQGFTFESTFKKLKTNKIALIDADKVKYIVSYKVFNYLQSGEIEMFQKDDIAIKFTKEFVNDIEGLTLYEKNDIVLNIFNELSKSIGYKKGAKISKKKILDDIRNKIFGIVNQNINNNYCINLLK